MSKNIIFCADGTWDDPQNSTNVYTLYKAVTTSSGQASYYDDGVGSDGTPLQKLAGGAMGAGLFQKIKDGYTKIAQAYEQDDPIFLFGFSRGAYTARSLAGMIAICGLPTTNPTDTLINDAFDAYRDPTKRPALQTNYNLYDAQITMVGVWDTVGALGIPAIAGGVDPVQFGFLDTNLHPDVRNAFQALAIDERRREFPATLWNLPATPIPNQTVQQTWFSGVHCDVGGGYPETGLSDITLGWMMLKAKNLGLEFAPDVFSEYSPLAATNALDQIHESWNPLWLFPKSRLIAPGSTLSNSVFIRCQYDVKYQPGNLTRNDGVPTAAYAVENVVTPAP